MWVLSDQELLGDASLTEPNSMQVSLKKSAAAFNRMVLYTNEDIGKTLGTWRINFGVGELRANKCWMLVRCLKVVTRVAYYYLINSTNIRLTLRLSYVVS